jgi:hypothetical protein
MTVRPPRALAPKITNIWTANPAGALDYELAQEKASTLGRLGRALEAALAALKAFDARAIEPTAETRREREALGLRDSRQVMRDYAVPSEVQGRMGMLPARTSR